MAGGIPHGQTNGEANGVTGVTGFCIQPWLEIPDLQDLPNRRYRKRCFFFAKKKKCHTVEAHLELQILKAQIGASDKSEEAQEVKHEAGWNGFDQGLSCRKKRVPRKPNIKIKIHMGVSKNRGGPPNSSILIGFSIINHPFWGTIIFGNTHIFKTSVYASTVFGRYHMMNFRQTLGCTGWCSESRWLATPNSVFFCKGPG